MTAIGLRERGALYCFRFNAYQPRVEDASEEKEEEG
jgi:hypothetical protein